ncbi:protein jagged-1b-like isoform X2 [Mytilus californianus]|uniref:protein jagged-1b-like isoform X2 n=1 Tax=Mytilus californianus TaxID=6549 RepID=UPI0022467D47|nr:protein jagged-1b-like isoform X2 [Mytilus californianus]
MGMMYNMEPLVKDNSSLTDHCSELLEEAHTLPPNTPNHRRYLKCMLIGIMILLIAAAAALGIAYALGCFSSNTEITSTTRNSTGIETEFMKNVVEAKDTELIKSDERGKYCVLYDISNIDPFNEICKPGSQYVKNHCNVFPQNCKDCCEDCKIILPIKCFCVKQLHCPDRNSDRPAKMEYDKCSGTHCPCRNGGTCSKDPTRTRATAEDIKCSCSTGFSGLYCQDITRICKENSSASKLQSIKTCSGNSDAKCYRLKNNITSICEIPQYQSQTYNITNCTNV